MSNQKNLMEQIVSDSNIDAARGHVYENLGSKKSRLNHDITQQDELEQWMGENWSKAKGLLLRGSYKPQPVRIKPITNLYGKTRELGIPALHDRLIQQAIYHGISDKFEPYFSNYSYGYRPGRNCHDAVDQAIKYIIEGKRFVVELDIEGYFDNINQTMLLRKINEKVYDPLVIKAIQRYISRGYIRNNKYYSKNIPNIGIYQGDVISPLLANIYLDPLDKELEGVPFVRFADDIKCFSNSTRGGKTLITTIARDLERDFKLKINQQKSRVIHYTKADIFGFSITLENGKPIVHLSSKAEKNYKIKLQGKIEENQSKSIEEIIGAVNKFIRGWMEYYKIIEDHQPLIRLDTYTQELVTKTLGEGQTLSIDSLYKIYGEIHTTLDSVA